MGAKGVVPYIYSMAHTRNHSSSCAAAENQRCFLALQYSSCQYFVIVMTSFLGFFLLRWLIRFPSLTQGGCEDFSFSFFSLHHTKNHPPPQRHESDVLRSPLQAILVGELTIHSKSVFCTRTGYEASTEHPQNLKKEKKKENNRHDTRRRYPPRRPPPSQQQ